MNLIFTDLNYWIIQGLVKQMHISERVILSM